MVLLNTFLDFLGVSIWYLGDRRKRGQEKGHIVFRKNREEVSERKGWPSWLFWGELSKAFIGTLKHCFGRSNVHLSPDLGLFNSCDIIAGPLQSVTYVEGRKWRYMNYPLLYYYYKLVEKLDRKVIFNKYFWKYH